MIHIINIYPHFIWKQYLIIIFLRVFLFCQ